MSNDHESHLHGTHPEHFFSPNYKFCIEGIATSFREKVEDGFNFPGEMHEVWEMVYVVEGFVYVSEEGRVYKLEQGNIIFHKPMEFHKIWCSNCPKAIFQVLSFYASDPILDTLGDKVMKLNIEKQAEISELYTLINETFDVNLHVYQKINPDPIAERMVFCKIEHFILSLCKEKEVSSTMQYSISAKNYKKIIDTMTENLRKNLSIEDLADLCGLSVSNMKKTFAKYNSNGIMQHFNRMKIKKAIVFLRQGYSIAEISGSMGFSSQNYFSVVFKRETGMLPSEFKKSDLK